MNKLEYRNYLKTKHWQEWKTYLYKKYRACQKCGATRGLEVHHLSYAHVGEERESELMLLCHSCHYSMEHPHRTRQETRKRAQMGWFRDLLYEVLGL